MNKLQFIVKIIALFVVVGGLTMCSTINPRGVRRGKVSESKKKLEITKDSGSGQDKSYWVCVVDANDKCTSEIYEMRKKRIPKWFILDNGSSAGNIVLFDTQSNKAVVEEFQHRGELKKQNNKYWMHEHDRDGLTCKKFKIYKKLHTS